MPGSIQRIAKAGDARIIRGEILRPVVELVAIDTARRDPAAHAAALVEKNRVEPGLSQAARTGKTRHARPDDDHASHAPPARCVFSSGHAGRADRREARIEQNMTGGLSNVWSGVIVPASPGIKGFGSPNKASALQAWLAAGCQGHGSAGRFAIALASRGQTIAEPMHQLVFAKVGSELIAPTFSDIFPPVSPTPRSRRKEPPPCQPMSSIPLRLPLHRSGDLTNSFPSAGSIALAATTPPMRSRWGMIRTASRPSSSRRTGQHGFHGHLPYPAQTKDVHHEIEMVVALSKGGKNIPIDQALNHVWGYGIGLDMTRRDLQGIAKDMGRPWEIGKAFEKSAPMGPLIPASEIGHPSAGKVELKVNGKVRQTGDLNQMIWKVPEMISYLSDYFELAAGDIIMTGTPSGVAAVVAGDTMEATVEGVGTLVVKVI